MKTAPMVFFKVLDINTINVKRWHKFSYIINNLADNMNYLPYLRITSSFYVLTITINTDI